MKTMAFASRNAKEILRDKLNLFFGLGFPLVLLLLLSAIQANVPADIFGIQKLTPGMAMFGLSFISLFSGFLIAKDRTSSFMLRLLTTPLRARDFIVGYTLPLLPIALGQTVVCYLAALLLGLPFQIGILPAILVNIPAALLFIALGLLCGAVFTDKQVGGICGALLTQLAAWLSGTWFDLSLVGGAFQAIAECLPFYHAVQAGYAALSGAYANIWPHLLWVTAYALVFLILAVTVFTKKMRS